MTRGAQLVTKGGKHIPGTEARVTLKARVTDLSATPRLPLLLLLLLLAESWVSGSGHAARRLLAGCPPPPSPPPSGPAGGKGKAIPMTTALAFH